MHDHQRSHFILLVLFFFPMLDACQPSIPPVLETTTPIPPTATSIPPTLTPTITLTPEPSLTATPEGCREMSGHVEHFQINDAALTLPLEVNVYLPPCYPEVGRSYPVLIMFHGQSMDEEVWRRMGMDKVADSLISSGDLPPIIIIMPREVYYLQELGESSFGDAVMNFLVPWTRKTFPTCPGRTCLAIGGFSRGALWAGRLGWLNWQTFGSIGAHSLPHSPLSEIVFRDLVRTIPPEQIPRQYMDVGVFDGFIGTAHEFEMLMTKYGMPHTWIVNPGLHNEEYWKKFLPVYLQWYGEPWKAMADKMASPAP
jgi:enterochelin esterase-like enzyme